MKLKTNKAIRKRMRFTKNKKIKIRAGGQDHFNARESGKTKRNKKRDKSLSAVNYRGVKKMLPYA